MNIESVLKEQKTISTQQWAEIRKLAALCRIKDQISDLLQDAPELDITELFDFIMSLTERELKRRGMKNNSPVS